MSWQTTLTLVVRHLIDDVDSIDYTDARIQETLSIAALIVTQQYVFKTTYVIDMATPDITPDPVVTNDGIAMALFPLKAACILTMNNYQSTIKGAGKVADGDSRVDLTAGFGGYRDIINLGPCASYGRLLYDLRLKKSMLGGTSVVGPFTSAGFSVTGQGFGYGHTRFLYDTVISRYR